MRGVASGYNGVRKYDPTTNVSTEIFVWPATPSSPGGDIIQASDGTILAVDDSVSPSVVRAFKP